MRKLVSHKKLTKIMIVVVLLFGILPIGGTVFAAHEVYINEIQVSTSGIDWEFFELQGAAGTDLSDLTLIGVESDTGTLAGTIDKAISLAGQSIPADGFWLGISPAGVAAYSVTGELSISDNSFENGTATYFLVSNFTGSAGDDLDVNDDGTLDSMPWDEIVDSINLRDNTSDFDYGAPSVGPDGSFLPSGTYRCPDAPDGSFTNIHSFGTPDGTPGVSNDCEAPTGPIAVKIHEVQGSGDTSPLDGSAVIVEGIVVGDFQDDLGANGDLDGFFLQEEDADADGDPLTSEGVFIYQGSNPTVDVAIGDLVQVEGDVSEFNGLTQVSSFSGVTVVSSMNPLPSITMLSLPIASLDAFEPYESMYVTFPQALFISEYFNFDRFGEIVLTADRQFQPTAVYNPGSPEAAALLEQNLLGRVTLDDGRTAQNPDPAIHPNGMEFDLDNLFRGGDTVSSLTGVMHYAFGLYRIQPTQGADYTSANPRPAAPDAVGGTLEVASFNVLNYFTTLDNSGAICGPLENQGCRGADNAGEFTRQRTKIIAALTAIDADVVGLIEIENNVDDDAVIDLVAGLNDAMGAGTYAYVDTGPIGSDAIKVAFIYKPDTVSLVGDYSILDSTVDARFLDTKNRPVLAQSFMDNATGGIFTAAVNHLKSKGSSCADVGDPDLGDGAGNCNLTRLAAAEAMVDWLASDPTGSGDADFLIIGDLNSYDKEDPIDALLAGGYTDLLYEYIGEFAYSYVFNGQLGYLDHALANGDLLSEVTGATVWHINADEPDIIDYDTSFKKAAQDALYEPNAYRSSDHDPVLVGLDVCDEIAPTLEITLSPDELWPAHHQYVDVTATVIATDNFDPDPTVTLLSVTSNEEDEGLGDGDFPNDIVIIDDYTFQLRAERGATNQEGRTYTITYQVVDDCGNITVDSATVFVPFSQKGKNN